MSLRDIVSMSSANYLLDILLFDGSRLRISGLGHGHARYDQGTAHIPERSDHERSVDGRKLRKQGVKERSSYSAAPRGPARCACTTPRSSSCPAAPLMRIGTAISVGIEASNYAPEMELESGERLSIVMLGRELDP